MAILSERLQISVGFDTVVPATFDDRVNDRAALTRIGIPEEQPVLLSKSGRSDRVLNEVIINLDLGLMEINLEGLPLAQCIADGLALRAFGQEASGDVPPLQNPMDPSANGRTLTDAISISQRRTGALTA